MKDSNSENAGKIRFKEVDLAREGHATSLGTLVQIVGGDYSVHACNRLDRLDVNSTAYSDLRNELVELLSVIDCIQKNIHDGVSGSTTLLRKVAEARSIVQVQDFAYGIEVLLSMLSDGGRKLLALKEKITFVLELHPLKKNCTPLPRTSA